MRETSLVWDEWIFTIKLDRSRRACGVECCNPAAEDRDFAAALARVIEAWIGLRVLGAGRWKADQGGPRRSGLDQGGPDQDAPDDGGPGREGPDPGLVADLVDAAAVSRGVGGPAPR